MLRPPGDLPDLPRHGERMLTELDDHNCWTMAEAAGHPGPHKMQHLLSRARVDDQRVAGTAADWAAGRLCAGQDPGDVVLIVDETGDAKTSGDCANERPWQVRCSVGRVRGLALLGPMWWGAWRPGPARPGPGRGQRQAGRCRG